MKLFTLKFTDENLARHMSHNPDEIPTTRNERKGEPGDITIIDGVIYELGNIYEYTLKFLSGVYSGVWKWSGFKTQDEYINEIERIYGNDPEMLLYVHLLKRVTMREK